MEFRRIIRLSMILMLPSLVKFMFTVQDLLFASHVFEHSYDFTKVAAECIRVLSHGGHIYFEVPQNFQPTEHDRVSFQGVSAILEGFPDSSVDVLFDETGTDKDGQDFLRGILRSTISDGV